MAERINRKRPLQTRPERVARRREAPKRPGWDEQEERSAEAIPGGSRVRGSGCSGRPSRKSDVAGTWMRNEDKTTGKKAIRVVRADLEKIKREARDNGQKPSLTLGYDRDGRLPREDWMAFPLPLAAQMMSVVDAILQGDIEEATALAELVVS